MNNSSGNNFYIRAKRTVYKWWCVIYKPVYKLFHQGYWPAEKEPYYIPDPEPAHEDAPETVDDSKRLLAEQMARRIEAENQHDIDSIVLSARQAANTDEQTKTVTDEQENEALLAPAASGDTADSEAQQVSEDVMARAQEIMERLAREAAEDEAKKQAEIDAAKKKAEEQERLASILKANERDISIYIEEGKAQAKMNASKPKGE